MAFFYVYICSMIYFSIIVPVYNRPQEVDELLGSIVDQDFSSPFEVIIVEDGSSISSEEIVAKYRSNIDIQYYYKNNSGPGDSRNFGMKKARGNYFIILDSDCLLTPHYLTTVNSFLSRNYVDCFGGADAAHDSFTPLQKAINYAMTSFFTTGGIRGSKGIVQKFEPRSFNMGISKQAFLATGGFGKIHPGEDPDLSQRILKAGFNTTFIPGAEVYHKRRISWKKFYQQVRKFGLVRPILNIWHPEAARITFWFPSVFVLFVMASLLLSILYSWFFLLPLLFYILLIFIDSSLKNKSFSIGILSVYAVFIQFFGYGWAYIQSYWAVAVRNKEAQKHFPFLFFK